MDDEFIESAIAAWCAGSSVVGRVDAMLREMSESGRDAEYRHLVKLRSLVMDAGWSSLPQNVNRRRDWLYRQTVSERALIQADKHKKLAEEEARRKAEAARIAAEQLARAKRRTEALATLREALRSNYLQIDSVFASIDPNLIDERTFRSERTAFIQAWARSALPPEKNGGPFKLDDEQAFAVGTLDHTVKVAARAGSGKTRVLAARTVFLIKHCRVPAWEILLLAFNRKAALQLRTAILNLLLPGASETVKAEIKQRKAKWSATDEISAGHAVIDRLSADASLVLPPVLTFHALARSIVHTNDGVEQPDLLVDKEDDESQSRALQDVIDDHLRSLGFGDQVRHVMMSHFEEDWERIARGGYHLTKEELIKHREALPFETLAGEFVKSGGEKAIANFLFRNEVPYKYERNHTWDGINYRPDFTIFKTARTGIIVEYFGMRGDSDYDDMSEQKRSYWRSKDGWTLVEMDRAEFDGGPQEFCRRLHVKLIQLGVEMRSLTDDEVWLKIKDRAIDRFTRVMRGFVARCRKRMLTPDTLLDEIERHSSISGAEEQFIRLAHRIYGAYLDRLQAHGEDDFDGLLMRAAAIVERGGDRFASRRVAGSVSKLNWLMIDEFQDFSDLFYGLIASVRAANPRLRTFCVGDDWQAINGFAGSELKYFEDFGSYAGSFKELHIATNYRSSREVVEAGNSVMAITGGKPARADRGTAGSVHVCDLQSFVPERIEQHEFPGDWITPVVLRLTARFTGEGRRVTFLSRTNFVGSYVCDSRARELDGFLEFVRRRLPAESAQRVTASTAHGYKGLEDDVVLIIDVTARRYPLIHPDWVFTRVLGDNLDRVVAEERRLFYVAVTRAENTLILITDSRNPSPFLSHIEAISASRRLGWGDFPAPTAEHDHGVDVTILIRSQRGRGSSPTASISPLLRACNYRFDSVKKEWWKRSERSKFEQIRREMWAAEANGVEVRVEKGDGGLLARFHVEQGVWSAESLE